MIKPNLQEAIALARQGTVLPVYASILADTETPVSVWMKLYKQEPCSFLLESVTGDETSARYSFIGGNPFMLFTANGTQWKVSGRLDQSGEGNPIHKLRELMKEFTPVAVPGLPRFCGGAVGYVSYDAVRLSEKIPDRHARDERLDEITFGFYRDLIVFDNREHRVLIISAIIGDERNDLSVSYAAARARIDRTIERLAVPLGVCPVNVHQRGEVLSNVKRSDYEAAVEKCKEYIKAGDIFQVVLSQRFSVAVDGDPFDLYRLLRTVNPSPYMFFLSVNGQSVVGASPEMLVRVEHGLVEMRPIAGTSPRGATEADDKAAAQRLLADPKERAEHVMLVDLGRNDVGRVSAPATVRVEEMMHIEHFSHVMHIVSNVKGTLKEGCDVFDALFSCFPAGTLSGAPKIRAMEIIDELETCRRGLYGGALGYIDWSGNLDTCIVIRTIHYRDGIASVQVGAGIVADSVPAREYEETVHKGQALFTAIRDASRIIGIASES